MEASKVTVGDKTYDMNFLGKKKRTNLRRKLIVEYIQSKPSGEIISISDFQEVGKFNNYPTTWSFVQSMIKQGVIAQYKGEKPRSYYYGVIGAVRVSKPKTAEGGVQPSESTTRLPDINSFIKDMTNLGVSFTITISNEVKK